MILGVILDLSCGLAVLLICLAGVASTPLLRRRKGWPALPFGLGMIGLGALTLLRLVLSALSRVALLQDNWELAERLGAWPILLGLTLAEAACVLLVVVGALAVGPKAP